MGFQACFLNLLFLSPGSCEHLGNDPVDERSFTLCVCACTHTHASIQLLCCIFRERESENLSLGEAIDINLEHSTLPSAQHG